MGPVTLKGIDKDSQLEEIAKQLKIANELTLIRTLISIYGVNEDYQEILEELEEKI